MIGARRSPITPLPEAYTWREHRSTCTMEPWEDRGPFTVFDLQGMGEGG
jgi:hypothetical protein